MRLRADSRCGPTFEDATARSLIPWYAYNLTAWVLRLQACNIKQFASHDFPAACIMKQPKPGKFDAGSVHTALSLLCLNITLCRSWDFQELKEVRRLPKREPWHLTPDSLDIFNLGSRLEICRASLHRRGKEHALLSCKRVSASNSFLEHMHFI